MDETLKENTEKWNLILRKAAALDWLEENKYEITAMYFDNWQEPQLLGEWRISRVGKLLALDPNLLDAVEKARVAQGEADHEHH